LKDPDTDDLDDGWDDPEPGVPSKAVVSAVESDGLDDLDAGWDDGEPFAAGVARGHETAARVARASPDRLSKRERRAFERKKRALDEKRRTERRAEEKRERREQARRAAEVCEAERREAAERTERARREKPAKPSPEPSAGKPKAARAKRRAAEAVTNPETTRRRRFAMPNGGWIIVVLAFITLATAWYAFGR
jgi:cobalamin biosynthesis Mg chelatase CobN